jgi:hypothetical protein
LIDKTINNYLRNTNNFNVIITVTSRIVRIIVSGLACTFEPCNLKSGGFAWSRGRSALGMLWDVHCRGTHMSTQE